jgi:succinoglycan biosynthesis transport protein ExoP
MSIIQFLRILWSRSLIVVICLVAALLGGTLVSILAQPRYEAKSRIDMGLMRPDPVTGARMSNPKAMGAYIGTQREVIRGDEVAGQAAEDLGWLSDPNLIRQYQQRPATDSNIDFRRWTAQRVKGRTAVGTAAGQMLEITFSSSNPVEAKIGAESLRKAYLEYSLASRRADAAKNAAWWAQQADVARRAAEKAELQKADLEKQYGIVLEGRGDMDSQRLQALAGQAAGISGAPSVQLGAMSSAANLQLAQIDAQIAQLSASLGPNHPQMRELQARRTTTALVVSQEQDIARRNASGQTARAAIESALAAQTSIVLSQRDKVERLRQLASEVDLRRSQYQKTASRAGELTIEAAATDTGMRPEGVVSTPTKPVFPNKPLIFGGAGALGAAFGLMLALLVELVNRRVRGIEDLELPLNLPCLAVISGGSSPWRETLRRLTAGIRPRRVAAA